MTIAMIISTVIAFIGEIIMQIGFMRQKQLIKDYINLPYIGMIIMFIGMFFVIICGIIMQL